MGHRWRRLCRWWRWPWRPPPCCGRGLSIPRNFAAVFGIVYLGIPLGLLVSLRGAGWMAGGGAACRNSGRERFDAVLHRAACSAAAPWRRAISPKKTIEGAVGGVVAAAIFLAAAGPLILPAFSRGGLAGLGVAVALLGICGDLFESQLKRGAGIKDSSHLIPGHGGVLDRVDALLFAAPAFYLYVRGGL